MVIVSDFREPYIEGVEKTNLANGDFHIIHDYKVRFVVERKTLSDLSASIKDGRFREQRTRVLSCIDSNCIVYIIESGPQNKFSLPQSTLDMACRNLQFIHNIKVVFSRDFDDTVSILKYLDNLKTDSKNPKTDFTVVKKSSIQATNALSIQLRTIPGVSATLADKIHQEFKTMENLINSLKENNTCLVGIKISDKRLLGKVLCQKIYNALFT